MDVVEHEPAGAGHCFDVFREQRGHAKVLCTLRGLHCGVVNRDGEVFEQAGLFCEEEQFCLDELEFEVVGRHRS
jgi:hypothetical protein